ncbi:uncharacterized protein LAESUDRAFT_122935 [Laetiporus sulphureus 93-53]|uniref:Uncharacterized protein n=1 Tax=Laetiporus sulphureus 93-53 TaxID=1314785 RepID=A0A165ELA4_9APHY|nr:uncharacterized protein LAESUDRAFT_122935 [Laetiporus sulphureus 93-53]KZT07294.1 hypothetical protein LAESUDRAFT_122935 [Laetiporus sulphureus 93-53]
MTSARRSLESTSGMTVPIPSQSEPRMSGGVRKLRSWGLYESPAVSSSSPGSDCVSPSTNTRGGDVEGHDSAMTVDPGSHDVRRGWSPSRDQSRDASPPGAPHSPTISSARRPTQGELAREQKLRTDPMVIVHSPQFVECVRCGSTIKLSMKSAFDPAHWQKHRERCNKRPDNVVQEMRANAPVRNLASDAPPSITSRESQQQPSFPSEVKIASAVKRHITPSSSPLPPLTPDEDDSMSRVSSSKEESEPEVESLTAPAIIIHEPSAEFEEYLIRSQRRPTRELSPLLGNWQEWDWSHLKAPVWSTEPLLDCSDKVCDGGRRDLLAPGTPDHPFARLFPVKPEDEDC